MHGVIAPLDYECWFFKQLGSHREFTDHCHLVCLVIQKLVNIKLLQCTLHHICAQTDYNVDRPENPIH